MDNKKIISHITRRSSQRNIKNNLNQNNNNNNNITNITNIENNSSTTNQINVNELNNVKEDITIEEKDKNTEFLSKKTKNDESSQFYDILSNPNKFNK